MKDPYPQYRPPGQHEPPKWTVWLAVGALTLLVLTNVAWVIAYSALSQKVYQLQQTSPSPSTTPSPSASPVNTGTITGHVGYPAGTAPAQKVCAVDVADAAKLYCVDHPAGNDLAYSLTVPKGTYYVYASLKTAQGQFTTSYKAYYNKFVTCGSSPDGCAMGLHTQYEPVTVTAGGGVGNVDPTDWYALSVGQ